MEIIGHERAINFPIGCTLRLPSLQYYSYERYDDSQRRDCNGYEVLRGLEPIHGNNATTTGGARGGTLSSSRSRLRGSDRASDTAGTALSTWANGTLMARYGLPGEVEGVGVQPAAGLIQHPGLMFGISEGLAPERDRR